MHKILITGASGFVGTAVCEALTGRGIPFVATVRSQRTAWQYQVGELNGATDWHAALAGCDVVMHLAARVHVMHETAADALSAYREVNVAATMNLARQAHMNGVKRFVFVSSVKVNGEATGQRPFSSADQPAPLDPYGISKLEAETALQEFARNSGMELVIIRPPLVYGPGVRANFQLLMKLVQRGVPLPLGSVDNRRSMVALDNLVDLLILCCSHGAAPGQIFMVSDDHDVSVSTLLHMLARAMGKRPRLLSVPTSWIAAAAALLGKSTQADRVLGSLQVDITHTKQTLNWKPQVGMQQAIDKTVASFLSSIHASVVK
ncbi:MULTISPECIES: SDR family oxidoreductase [unclassified Janthinobacterium]|uniref:UDP-glucose 4-epimerase family protein n=1 Tax=unclassified Janthinobacterium TaxID=2610881 RepID=UPI00160DC102|nr:MULTISPECIES: SDR family oxidoreductase [unclassified Janthinobacterium]MBB5367751.1 UDP-glucose 4-epimerase [Janthinobacterium sp. K2C7]MBB5379771.1 UDP-glucose 4-epimerase [Janthinobacterium sp. K2Li3]MBB5386133.1 UDP-glucose 4-epimerase [Janthinobacterium sp. K2E3]